MLFPGVPREFHLDYTGSADEVRNPKPPHKVCAAIRTYERSCELIRSNINDTYYVRICDQCGNDYWFLGNYDRYDDAFAAFQEFVKWH